ncbi:MAG: peptide transporter [Thermoprotei archaeon]|nr:MAG: peptide transporter [Thermoprotei archaeon]
MKAYVSVDLEGMPHIVSRDHLAPSRPLFDEARRIATALVAVAAEELKAQGFEEVIVADSHGAMVNLDVEELPEHVELVRGFPRPLSMVAGVEEADAVLFLGYHAKFGTQGAVFDHTYSGRVLRSVYVNGVEASEFLLNAYVAGHYSKPLILVAGDEALLEGDVAHHTPWAVRIPLKRSLSRYSAVSPSMRRIKALLREGVVEAVKRFRAGEARPLRASEPVTLRVVFQSTAYADVASLTPGAKRTSALEVEYVARNIVEAYRLLELWVLAAYSLER